VPEDDDFNGRFQWRGLGVLKKEDLQYSKKSRETAVKTSNATVVHMTIHMKVVHGFEMSFALGLG